MVHSAEAALSRAAPPAASPDKTMGAKPKEKKPHLDGAMRTNEPFLSGTMTFVVADPNTFAVVKCYATLLEQYSRSI